MAKLLLIGCGKMGGALLKRAAGEIATVTHVVDPLAPTDDLKSLPGVKWYATLDNLDAAFIPDLAVIALKPQVMTKTLPAYGRYSSTPFLSVAAGQTMARLATLLGNDNHAIVRAMPNLAASVNASMTVAVANKNVTQTQRDLCDGLLSCVGQVAWLKDEALMDAVTALSGSGPAYVFALAEAMAEAGKKLGLTHELSEQLARQTIIGSGALLAQSSESMAALRMAVTSPGGTTEAALKYLLADTGLGNLIEMAMTAARRRAKELAE